MLHIIITVYYACQYYSLTLLSNSTVNMDFWGLFYEHGLDSIRPGISNHMSSKVWDEITYPFPSFNGAVDEFSYPFPDFIGEVWEWISNCIPIYNGCN